MAKKNTKIEFTQILGVIGGAVGAQILNKTVEKFAPDLNPLVKSVIPIGVGVFLSTQKNTMFKGVGYGLIGSGGVSLVNAFMPQGVTGIEEFFMDGPAGQDILSDPAGQDILSAAVDEEGNFIGYVNSSGDIIEAPENFEENGIYAPEYEEVE